MASSARVGGGGRGAQRGRQEGRQKRRAGKKENSDIIIDALSHTNRSPGIESQCSAAQEDHTTKGIAHQESPALWNHPPNHSIFRIRKGGRTILDHPHYPIKEIHDNQPIGLLSLGVVILVLDGSRFCVSRTKNGEEKCECKSK